MIDLGKASFRLPDNGGCFIISAVSAPDFDFFEQLDVVEHLRLLGPEIALNLEFRHITTISGEEWIEVLPRTHLGVCATVYGTPVFVVRLLIRPDGR